MLFIELELYMLCIAAVHYAKLCMCYASYACAVVAVRWCVAPAVMFLEQLHKNVHWLHCDASQCLGKVMCCCNLSYTIN